MEANASEFASEREEIRDRLRKWKDVGRVARWVDRRHPQRLGIGPVVALAESLWRDGGDEERSLAVQLLAGRERWLDSSYWPLFKGWLEEVSSKEHCDGIAAALIGSIVAGDHSWVRVLRHWAESPNPWFRRAAVLGVLRRGRQMGDVEAARSVCELLKEERDERVSDAVERVLAAIRFGCLDGKAPLD